MTQNQGEALFEFLYDIATDSAKRDSFMLEPESFVGNYDLSQAQKEAILTAQAGEGTDDFDDAVRGALGYIEPTLIC